MCEIVQVVKFIGKMEFPTLGLHLLSNIICNLIEQTVYVCLTTIMKIKRIKIGLEIIIIKLSGCRCAGSLFKEFKSALYAHTFSYVLLVLVTQHSGGEAKLNTSSTTTTLNSTSTPLILESYLESILFFKNRLCEKSLTRTSLASLRRVKFVLTPHLNLPFDDIESRLS